MPDVTLQAVKSAAISEQYPRENYSTAASELLTDKNSGYLRQLLVGFAQPADAIKYKKVTGGLLYAYLTPLRASDYAEMAQLTDSFDAAAVTYASAPYGIWAAYGSPVVGYQTPGWSNADIGDSYCARMARYGALLTCADSYCDTSRSGNAPYLVLSYEDTDVKLQPTGCSPSSGYVPKNKANAFSWGTAYSGACVGDITQAAATFRWRTGEGATVTEIACGTGSRCTVPAGTFASDSIQWQVEITDSNGNVSASAWYTLSTVEALSTASVTAPADDMIDGTQACTVSWQHVISTGTEPTGYELQSSPDGSAWTALASATDTAETQSVIAAGVLAAGDLYLRVRTYNQDGAAGAWSNSVHDIVVAAPAAPSVTTDGAARPKISWQASGQQGWEASVDGVSTGAQYGADAFCVWDDYLTDGQHTAAVRIVNKYGLWSDWGECAVNISHSSGAEIVMTAAADHRAVLSWTTEGAFAKYLIYRDGAKIGETAARSYTDDFSIGSVKYLVRGITDDRNVYGLSNAASADIICDTVMICDVLTGVWTELRISADSDRTVKRTDSADTGYTHYSGTAYPTASRSGFRDRSYQFDAAYRADDAAGMAAFEALLGRTVILKDGWGNMAVGVVDALGKACRTFTVEYSCTVRQIRYP